MPRQKHLPSLLSALREPVQGPPYHYPTAVSPPCLHPVSTRQSGEHLSSRYGDSTPPLPRALLPTEHPLPHSRTRKPLGNYGKRGLHLRQKRPASTAKEACIYDNEACVHVQVRQSARPAATGYSRAPLPLCPPPLPLLLLFMHLQTGLATYDMTQPRRCNVSSPPPLNSLAHRHHLPSISSLPAHSLHSHMPRHLEHSPATASPQPNFLSLHLDGNGGIRHELVKQVRGSEFGRHRPPVKSQPCACESCACVGMCERAHACTCQVSADTLACTCRFTLA